MTPMGDENPLLREERELADKERAADGPARPGTWMAILGALLAFLGPLVGFLTGTIFGVQAEGPFGLTPLTFWMFLGLVVGGIGGVAAILGILRLVRDANGGVTANVLLGDFADAGGYDAHGRIIARGDAATEDGNTGTAEPQADTRP